MMNLHVFYMKGLYYFCFVNVVFLILSHVIVFPKTLPIFGGILIKSMKLFKIYEFHKKIYRTCAMSHVLSRYNVCQTSGVDHYTIPSKIYNLNNINIINRNTDHFYHIITMIFIILIFFFMKFRNGFG